MMAAAARHPAGARLSATLLAGETGVPLADRAETDRAGSPRPGCSIPRAAPAAASASPAVAGEISLADIVEAVEGPIVMTSCVDTERHECALEGACQVRPHMGVVNVAVRGALQGVSLSSLAEVKA